MFTELDVNTDLFNPAKVLETHAQESFRRLMRVKDLLEKGSGSRCLRLCLLSRMVKHDKGLDFPRRPFVRDRTRFRLREGNDLGLT